jgi:hypothetical protein
VRSIDVPVSQARLISPFHVLSSGAEFWVSRHLSVNVDLAFVMQRLDT